MIRRFFCALMAALLLCGCASARELDLVRLHVVAEDNSHSAQALKMEIRDACLRCARICLAGCADSGDAYIRLQRHAADFQSACENRARELGYTGKISAETGVFAFPDRIYGGVLAPAGDYPALRITIGKGEGRNWWCVLYPGLCALDESALDDPASILSWLRRCFGGV